MLQLILLLYSVTNVLGTGEAVADFEEISRSINRSLIQIDDEILCEHTWMYFANGSCHCGGDVHGTVKCSTNPDKVSVSACNCITYDEEGGVLTGASPYGCGFAKILDRNQQHSLPSNISELNKAMCGRFNRDGRLCSKCQVGFCPLAYSYDYSCIECTNGAYNWLKFIAVAFIPLTFFYVYVMVVLFGVNATNPYLYGFITLNQALTTPANLRAV